MIKRIVTRFASGLRYPTLFKLAAALFLVDLVVPDAVPFMDEILLALGTLLLGSLRRRREATPPGGALNGEADRRAGEATGGQP